ncbi:MAG: MerR family transcriptional regulator [Candidatus Firestonebacteria bacterium]
MIDEFKIPDKLFFTISEVSEITHVKPYILRYWENQFKSLKPGRGIGGQRTYRKKDMAIIFQIHKLLYEDKFTLKGAKIKIKELKKKNEQQIEIDFKEVEFKEKISKLKKKLSDLKSTIE